MTDADDLDADDARTARGPRAAGTAKGSGDRGSGTGGKDGETRSTVLVALAANLVIAVAKAAGGVFSGSAALLSEAAHSVADSMNEVFLLASLRRSRRAPDVDHPFGYGKERFFWSLLAAVGIFVTGGCFSFAQGVEAFRSPEAESTAGFLVGLAVLVASLLAEGTSLLRALLQVRSEAREAHNGLLRQIGRTRDPALRTVLAEDSTAVIGVLLATAGITLHHVTGDGRWEGAASLFIGALLMYVAFTLGRDARGELIGQAADPRLRRDMRAHLDAQPEIDTVTALLTMQLGTESTLLAARVDLHGGLDSEEVEEVSGRIKQSIRERWPVVDQIFLDIGDASAADRRRAGLERDSLDRIVASDEHPDGP
jgi:cation diffusion facilitator family transporter